VRREQIYDPIGSLSTDSHQHSFSILRFYRQYAARSTVHAEMDVDALVYGDADGFTKKVGMAALRLLSDDTFQVFALPSLERIPSTINALPCVPASAAHVERASERDPAQRLAGTSES